MKEAEDVAVGAEDHVPSASAVAAVRTAARNVFFAAKTDAAVPPLAGKDFDFNFVNKHRVPGLDSL